MFHIIQLKSYDGKVILTLHNEPELGLSRGDIINVSGRSFKVERIELDIYATDNVKVFVCAPMTADLTSEFADCVIKENPNWVRN